MLGLVSIGQNGCVFCRDVNGGLRRHLPLLFDPRQFLKIGDAVQESGEQLNGDLTWVLRIDVPLHHADHHLLQEVNCILQPF